VQDGFANCGCIAGQGLFHSPEAQQTWGNANTGVQTVTKYAAQAYIAAFTLGLGSAGPGIGSLSLEVPATADTVVLGLESQGLAETATSLGGRTLMGEGLGWRAAFSAAMSNPATCFIVCLNGVAGTSVYGQVMGAAMGAGAGGAFNYEMQQLYANGLLPSVQFFANGQFLGNPF
jgi:hypothetical protein